MKKVVYFLYLLTFLFFLAGCKGEVVELKHLAGQSALITSKTKDIRIDGESKSLYKSVSNDISIFFEAFSSEEENENKIIINEHEFIIQKAADRYAFMEQKIVVLGANIKNGILDLTIKVGKDNFGNLDMFRLRNLFIKVKGEEIWPTNFPKDDYINEAFNFGDSELKTDYRFNYQPTRSFSFIIPEKLLDCNAVLIDNELEEYNITYGNTSTVITNKAYFNVDINIEDNAEINDTHKLQITTSENVELVKTYMDGLLIPNDLDFSSNAWAKGEHTLRIVSLNSYGYIIEKNIKFKLGSIKDTTSNLNYKMYDPGLADTLPNDITSLGTEVEGDEYSSSFSSIPHLNYEITPTTDLTFLWSGLSLTNRTVFMQIYHANDKEYKTVSTAFVKDENTSVSVGYEVLNTADYLTNGKIYVRVASANLVTESTVSDYFYHVTDLQYMTQRAALNIGTSINKEAKQALRAVADYLISKDRDKSYMLFTGDMVQSKSNAVAEWEAVMESFFTPLLENDVRFGATTGNHDVGGLSENSTAGSNALDDELYYNYFSENLGYDVFKDKDYFGGTYKDNRSHYALVEFGGQEFLCLYLGWGSSITGIHISGQDIEYANTVLTQYPDKRVILALHDYVGSTNNRTVTGEYVFNQLVKKHTNIEIVVSGHVNSSSKKIDYLDDDKDGITDRQVLQLLTNFQEEESLYGAAFIREIGLDYTNNRLVCTIYSPFFNATEILMSMHQQIVKDNSHFVYDFDLNNLGYAMKSQALK